MKDNFTVVKRNEISKVVSVFVDAFMEDPLYIYLCQDDLKRKKLLPIFFEEYLKYMERYGYILADSDDYNGVMLFYFSEKQPGMIRSFYHLMLLYLGGLKSLKYISLKEYVDYIKKFKTFGSGWIDDQVEVNRWKEYIHFDMMVIREEMRGSGLFRTMVTPCFEWIDQHHLPSTIETHNASNLGIYYSLGYKLVKRIESEDGRLTQYCVVRNKK